MNQMDVGERQLLVVGRLPPPRYEIVRLSGGGVKGGSAGPLRGRTLDTSVREARLTWNGAGRAGRRHGDTVRLSPKRP